MAVRPIALGDEVRHLTSKKPVMGKVIAVYPKVSNPLIIRLDVRSTDDKIYYGTPAANWETTTPVEVLE